MLQILDPIPTFFMLMHLPMFHKRERGRAGGRKKRWERERERESARARKHSVNNEQVKEGVSKITALNSIYTVSRD